MVRAEEEGDLDWEAEFSRVREQRDRDNSPINVVRRKSGEIVNKAKEIELPKIPKLEGPGKEAGFNPEFNPVVLLSLLALFAFASSLLSTWQSSISQ
mmetsp:Transcript_6421/g.11836  ORF Transcript_6421/g.11836 Transcript_6421/m.11836 type:complete len:97 (-) Transcript_6421:20-310(-)